ncbi:hypothetical protein AAG570_000457 [Ranatra chinensis]|uniref:C2H2-type domain-containing protein n=1 Tax=Ranatra chinensis TaxID=642074 RepID=A0ABD0Z9T9_9HEMI
MEFLFSGEGEGEAPPEGQEEEGGGSQSGDEEAASVGTASSPAPSPSQPPNADQPDPVPNSRSSSPPILLPANCATSPTSPGVQSPDTESAALDFSTKRNSCESPVLNLSKSGSPPPETPLNSPLDLSVSSRKRSVSPQPRKAPRSAEYKPIVSPWTSPVVASHFPYFAAAVAAANTLSPKSNTHTEMWNGKMKISDKGFTTPTPSDATKALEKMSELSKLGGDEYSRPPGGSGGGRHSAWQSHWLNKGAEQAKDVLKCVWCKQSFPTLAAMTTHMKEAKHCGVNLPTPIIPPPPPPAPQHIPVSSPSGIPGPPAGNGKPNQSDLNLLIKETMPLPRKLVRGQDVWLGKGAEQTRQILKCMWCGQSFRSLAEMTSHMQQTQHYTNIISQEQIISWKSAEEGKTGATAPTGGGSSVGPAGGGGGGGNSSGAANSHVSAVLTCKVCDQAFSSLKELSNHMVKNSHYKEHIMRSITESGGRRRQTREKRKKSLPVRKLLELERAQNELKNGEGIMSLGKPTRDMHSAGRITCEKCKEKIDMAVFVDHIRLCVGGDHRNLLKNALLSSNVIHDGQPGVTQALHETRKMTNPGSPKDIKPEGKNTSPSVLNAIEKLIEKSFDSRARHGAGGFVGPGIPGQAPLGSSILKRLGIDESVDYTKPLVDAQTMNLLRSYHHQQSQHFGRRERSGSESSSVSEKGRNESSTPDRKYDPERFMSSTPRTTPEKRIQTPPSTKTSHEESADEEVHIKREIPDEVDTPVDATTRSDVVIKQEIENGNDDEEDRRSFQSDEPLAKRMSMEDPREDEDGGRSVRRSNSPPERQGGQRQQALQVRPPSGERGGSPSGRSSASPATSDTSATPRSSAEKKATGSLGALSSMFDNLSGGVGGPSGSGEGGGAMGGKGTSSHPLAALQKLCDKTETHPQHNSSSGRAASGGSGGSATSTPGAILAFSWACNDAIMTADSIMKCAFCDTPFISKGAYRHHLSKMHFVKDGVIPDPVALKPASSAPGKNGNSNNNGPSTSSGKSPPAQPNNYEESPHSKFLKYTELAKQLSSKYV